MGVSVTTASTTPKAITVNAAKLTISATHGRISPIPKPVCVSAQLPHCSTFPRPPGHPSCPSPELFFDCFQPVSATRTAPCRAPSATR